MGGSDAVPAGGERRPVTVVFADLVGSTHLAEGLDPEDWAVVLNRLYQSATGTITRYGGTVTQLSGDAIVALFGAPVAHEDDPERAVRAALDLVQAVAQLSADVRDEIGEVLEVRVGVNTGLAVVGAVGGAGHEEYTALGDAVNVAARMQTAARPGTVLVTQATYARVAGIVDAVDQGLLEVKGKAAPVRAHEIVSVTGRGAPRGIPGLYSPMVGREAELARLRHHIDTAHAGRGRIAVVLGEPGIGKSRLVAELRASAGGVRWVEGRCVSYGHALPYHLIRELVRAAAGNDFDDAMVGGTADERVRELLGDAPGESAGYLLHLLRLPIDQRLEELLSALEPAAVRSRYVGALRTMFSQLAKAGPVIVVCEDLHWADAASVDMLVDLVGTVDEAPIVLVVTARPDRDTDGWRFITHARARFGDALGELRLEPLSPEHSRQLVASLLEIESLPGQVRRLILDKTDGNPFFLEEVVRALIDRGVIVRQGDRWVAVDVTDVDLPDNVHALLVARIDRLTPDARRCLQLASVVGRTFTVSLLRRVIDGDATRQLGELEAHGLVTIAQTTPEIAYTFRHALVQEVAYGRLLRRERQGVHRRVAAALEETHDREEAAALLAHHLDQAGDADRAVPYLLAAGRQALTRYANREAVALLTRVGEILADRQDDEGTRQRVEAGLGRLQAGLTFVPAGEELAFAEQLLPDAERLGDERLLGHVHLWIGRSRSELGEWYTTSPQLRASMEHARDVGERLGDEVLVAMPLGIIGTGKYTTGRFEDEIRDLERAIDLLERREQLAQASLFASVAAMAGARRGSFASAEQWLERAVELAQRSADPNALIDTDLAAGLLETERGNVGDALAHTQRAIEQANEVGNIACALVGSFLLGDQHLRLGDATAAIPALERSSELAQYCDAGSFAALSGAWLAAARARAGADLQAELERFAASLEAAQVNGDQFGAGAIHLHRATILAAQPEPDWDAVIRDFESAVAIFERIGARPALGRALHGYGMVLEIAGRDAEATAMLKRAASVLDELTVDVARPRPDRAPSGGLA
jgi:class 3 adenylate cyclase/tetratricopeptide (TPR) repeat protein